MNGARNQFFSSSALARDQHRQIVALQPLDWIDDALHRGAGANKAGHERLERSLGRCVGRERWSLPGAAEIKALPCDRGHHSQATKQMMAKGSCGGNRDRTRTVGFSADAFDHQAA